MCQMLCCEPGCIEWKSSCCLQGVLNLVQEKNMWIGNYARHRKCSGHLYPVPQGSQTGSLSLLQCVEPGAWFWRCFLDKVGDLHSRQAESSLQMQGLRVGTCGVARQRPCVCKWLDRELGNNLWRSLPALLRGSDTSRGQRGACGDFIHHLPASHWKGTADVYWMDAWRVSGTVPLAAGTALTKVRTARGPYSLVEEQGAKSLFRWPCECSREAGPGGQHGLRG